MTAVVVSPDSVVAKRGTDASALARAAGVTPKHTFSRALSGFSAAMTPAQTAKVRLHPDFVSIQSNVEVTDTPAPADPVSPSDPYINSAGNDNVNPCTGHPSDVATMMMVGAIKEKDKPKKSSNYGPCVDIWAPGEHINAAKLGGGFVEKNGTSQAAPHVTGVAARILGKDPALTPAWLEFAIVGRQNTGQIVNLEQDKPGSHNRLLYLEPHH